MEKSTWEDFENWFQSTPDDAEWYIVSDYCFDDEEKSNDVVTFSVILKHDSLRNIKEYIKKYAPKDIKSTRTVSPEFLNYINSPVVFSISFVLDRKSKLFRDYVTVENMENFFPYFINFVKEFESHSAYEVGFLDSVIDRAKLLHRELNNKNPNAGLARKIYLVSTFLSLVFYYLYKAKNPSVINWVSDRDAIIDRHDGVIFDMAYFMWLYEVAELFEKNGNEGEIILDKPQINFFSLLNDKLDELIRIPDYIAGTLASLDITKNTLSKPKHIQVIEGSLKNSKNHAVIHLSYEPKIISVRRIQFIDKQNN